jgi:hypothetical protein
MSSKQQAAKLAEGEAAFNEANKAASKGLFKKPGEWRDRERKRKSS